MKFVRHDSADEFLRAAGPLLDAARAANSGLVTWARGLALGHAAGTEPILLATMHERGRPVGIAMRRGTGPLALGSSPAPVATAIARELADTMPDLAGVVGSLPACEAYARTWRRATGRVHALRFHLRDYALTALVPPRPASGFARLAVEDDADLLGEWLVAFLTEARVPDDPQRARSSVPKRIAEGRLWLWDDGGAAAMLGAVDVDTTAARIAPVYTPPEHRNRGYASALVAAVAHALLDRGKAAIFLTADRANPTSNAIYVRLGFRPQGDQYHFDFVTPDR